LTILKIILGVVFILCCLTLPILLIALAISKKKLGVYINQINKMGTIEHIKDIDAGFDLSLAAHIFEALPQVKNNPSYNKFKITLELEDRIAVLSKLVKPIAIIFGTTVILLIVLLNLLDN
jgi:hypothetical protein